MVTLTMLATRDSGRGKDSSIKRGTLYLSLPGFVEIRGKRETFLKFIKLILI